VGVERVDIERVENGWMLEKLNYIRVLLVLLFLGRPLSWILGLVRALGMRTR
jgi:hypothetical protein